MKKYIAVILLICTMTIPLRAYAYSTSEIVIEEHTGRILYGNNTEAILPMASTTKIMTAIVAIENGDLGSAVRASSFAASIPGSRMGLKEGDELSLYDMLVVLLYVSANDGATAIAEHISGNESDFAILMSRKAEEIGCENTSFVNAHGLDEEGHFTTASDLAKIAAYAIKNEVFYEIISSTSKQITVNGEKVTYYNKNKLRSMYEYGIGGKTGYTEEAGRCLVSYAEKDGMDLVCVVLNSTDTYGDSIALLKKAYDKYSMLKVASKGEHICTLPVKKSLTEKYDVSFPEDIYLPLTEDEAGKISVRYLLTDSLTAPIKQDSEIGRFAFMLGDERIYLGILTSEYEIQKRDSVIDIMKKLMIFNVRD